MNDTANILVIVLLLAANGFFVAAEFAMVKARAFRSQVRRGENSSATRLTRRIQGNLESYLATCQSGITIASLGLGWMGAHFVTTQVEPLFRQFGVSGSILHFGAFIVAFLIFSALHIVIGEQVPKTLAIRKAEPVSIWVAYPLHFSYLLLLPLNWVLSQASKAILALFNVGDASQVVEFKDKESQGLDAIPNRHSEMHKGLAAMFQNLFDFDLRRAGQIMIPISSVHILDISASSVRNLQTIRETHHSQFPLVDSHQDDVLIGIVLDKDIHRAILDGMAEPWRDLKKHSREPLIILETQRIARLVDIMRVRRAHMACVVNAHGSLVGIITLQDLLDEFVGDIDTESGKAISRNGITQLDDGSWEVDGLAELADVERLIGLEVSDDVAANTIGGLLLRRLARMPEIDDVITEAGFHLQVLAKDSRRVLRVRIMQIQAQIVALTEKNESA